MIDGFFYHAGPGPATVENMKLFIKGSIWYLLMIIQNFKKVTIWITHGF